jgi:16S rRNA G966 N2-methylase RsmD
VTKGTVLLLREDDPAPPKVRVDEGVAEGELPSSRDQLRLPRWISAWDRRAFFFSAALDPIVAQASLNIALHTHLKLHPDQTLPSDVHSADPFDAQDDTLRVFDPCLGSGTILAAAAARGIRRIVGADINAEFVARARSNLLDARLLGSGVRLFVHDAATPYLAEDLDPLSHSQLDPGSLSRTLVVSNPPWGNNIGEGLDGKAIVTSVTSQFAGATMCWIANPLAVEALRCLPGVTVLRHVPFGSVELVVCTASRF